MKTIAIIQARMGSTRLPGKVLKPVLGEPMLARMLERVKRAKSLDTVIVATTDKPEDDATAAVAERCGVQVFRGSALDVLDRYYHAAKQMGATPDMVIVRLMADCPLHDPSVIDEDAKHFIDMNDMFAYMGSPRNYPEGLDADIFTFGALEEAWKRAQLPSEREHVGQYFKNHPERFHWHSWTVGERDDSSMHWSVDTQADFDFVTKVFEQLYPVNPSFTKDDVLALLEQHPEFLEINKGSTGYEGLAKSLEEDKAFKKHSV